MKKWAMHHNGIIQIGLAGWLLAVYLMTAGCASGAGGRPELKKTPARISLAARKSKPRRQASPPPVSQDTSRINIQFKDLALGQALKLVTESFRKNLVVPEALTRPVSLTLFDASLSTALGSLLTPFGYTYWIEGNTVYVEKADAHIVRIFPLNRARADRLLDSFQKFSQEVQFQADSLRNLVMLSGPAAAVLSYERRLRRLDRARPDILIQAEIIELGEGVLQSLGINLQGKSNENALNSTFSANLANAFLQLGYLNNFQLRAFLEAIEELRDARILSRPRIVATSGEPASILAGERVPYARVTEETPAGGFLQQIEFVDVGIKLTIVAHAPAEGTSIILEVHPEVSEVLDKAVMGVPRIATREAHTRVVVEDGMTAVIGGLSRENRTVIERGIPLLRSLPLLGWLFKWKNVEVNRTELLVLITPRILTPERKQQLLREERRIY